MPRARDKYAASAHGEVAQKFGAPVSIGPQTGHVRPEDVIPPHFDSYMRTQQGKCRASPVEHENNPRFAMYA